MPLRAATASACRQRQVNPWPWQSHCAAPGQTRTRYVLAPSQRRLTRASRWRSRAFQATDNRVSSVDVGVKQDYAIVGARGALRAADEDLGLGTVADRQDGLPFDALADYLGLADEVEAGIARKDAAALGVRLERQRPTVQHDVIGGHVEEEILPLAALADDRQALPAAHVPDRMRFQDGPHIQFKAVRHRHCVIDP